MGREREDWSEVDFPDVCASCRTGYHECNHNAVEGILCACVDCGTERENAAEFFNGLEDFFKSIDPSRVGWETIEAEVQEEINDAAGEPPYRMTFGGGL